MRHTLIILVSRHNVEIVYENMSTNYLHVNQQSHSDFRGTPSIYPNSPSGQQTGSSPFQDF